MSRLYALIEKYCPDGVEFVQLSTVLDYEQPTKYIVEDTNYDDSFKTPVLTAGQTFVLGYTNEADGIYNATKENPTIIFDDFTTSFHWVEFDFKIKSSAMKILRVKTERKEDALFRYIYHCMKNINYKPADHSRQWIAKYSSFKIPLPPVPVQVEIVRILDNFTKLTAKLTAELTVRKEQYEYYRDNLLTFGDDVAMMPLEDVAKSGLSYGSGASAISFDGNIRYIRITDINENGVLNENKTSPNIFNSKYLLDEGDILFARSGATVGKTYKYDKTDGMAIYAGYLIRLITDRHIALPDYVYHCVNTSMYWDFVNKTKSPGSQPNINAQQYGKFKIPVPSIPKQQHIVDVLDRFDKFCNDISEGLPAEIKVREEQYEYYRNKLLTFKKKEDK